MILKFKNQKHLIKWLVVIEFWIQEYILEVYWYKLSITEIFYQTFKQTSWPTHSSWLLTEDTRLLGQRRLLAMTHSNSTTQGSTMLILLVPLPTKDLKDQVTPEHVIGFIIGEEILIWKKKYMVLTRVNWKLCQSLTGSFVIELNTHWAQELKKLHMRFSGNWRNCGPNCYLGLTR